MLDFVSRSADEYADPILDGTTGQIERLSPRVVGQEGNFEQKNQVSERQDRIDLGLPETHLKGHSVLALMFACGKPFHTGRYEYLSLDPHTHSPLIHLTLPNHPKTFFVSGSEPLEDWINTVQGHHWPRILRLGA